MAWFFKLTPAHQNEEVPGHQDGNPPAIERNNAPTAPMNLLLRFETPNGPRTVITSSVPLQMAREVVDAMIKAGHYAEYVDRCLPHSVADLLVMKKLEQLRMRRPDRAVHAGDTSGRLEHGVQPGAAVHIAAE